jgi:hypothetical protein
MAHHYSILAAAAATLLLLPTAETRAETIVVESRCASGGTYTEGGTGWGNSTSKSSLTPCAAGSRSTRSAGAWADFTPTITTEGHFDVFLTWGMMDNMNNGPNAENVQVTITADDGTQTFFVNMRAHTGCAPNNANQLVYIGRGYFKPSMGNKVRIANTATSQCNNGAMRRYMSADAAVFESVAPLPTEETTWGSLKTRFLD